MKAKSIIAAVLITIGLLVCFSAAASMDAGASWKAGAILSRDVEVAETEDTEEWRDAS